MLFQLIARGFSDCCWLGVSSGQDGLDVAGFAFGLVNAAALAETAGLTGCANPVAGSASTQAITDIANLGDQREMRLRKTRACESILVT